VRALKERDNQAFGFLYDNYSGALYSIIKQIITDNAELASDVLQEGLYQYLAQDRIL